MRLIFTTLLFTVSLLLSAQDNNPAIVGEGANTWAKKLKDYKIEPIIGLQLWSTYTTGMEVYNPDSGQYETVDDRFNTQLRRSRLGVKGQPYKNLSFNITTSLDLVGKDLLSGTQGGGNNGASPFFRIWNAFVQWKVLDKKDAIHLTVGYLVPQIGRESITAALRSTSMEKSWSQNYLRRQLTGTGPGRAAGLNVGGLLYNADKKLGWSYDLGVFNPLYETLNGNSVGAKFSALYVGRAVLHIGDPEFKKYSISHKINYMSKRKGVSLGLVGAYQGETVLFKEQTALGADILLNWGPVNFDGEWTLMARTAEETFDSKTKTFASEFNTGYFRLSYNIALPNDRILEPLIMVMQFNGALDAVDQAHAAAVKSFAGRDYNYDLGLNYYLNPDFKLSLHYTFHQADAGDAADGATFNNYYNQSGVGAIRRGDWLGLGAVVIF